jgi:hypothetical protein
MFDSGATGSGTWLPAALTAFGGFATAALSYLSLRVLDARKAERTYQREKVARDAARRDILLERRSQFQRQTLLDLQDAVMKLVRTTGEMQHLDIMSSRAGERWHEKPYPNDLDQRAHSAAVQTTVLGVRVSDESIRNLLKQLKAGTNGVLFSRNLNEAERATGMMAEVFDLLNERIGEVLRKLDDIDDLDGTK